MGRRWISSATGSGVSLSTANTWTQTQTGPFYDKGGAVYNVRAFGAKPDGVIRADGAMTSGSGVINSALGHFFPSDIGKTMVVTGAGVAGADLYSTIFSYQSTTQVTLTDAASTTVSGKVYVYGTDNTAAFNSCVAAAAFSQVLIPNGTYLTYAWNNITTSISIQGAIKGQSTLIPLSESPIIPLNVGSAASIAYHYQINDISFYGAVNHTAGCAIKLGKIGAGFFNNITVSRYDATHALYEGIYIEEASDCTFNNLRVSGCNSHGVHIEVIPDTTTRHIVEMVFDSGCSCSVNGGDGYYLRNGNSGANSTVEGIHWGAGNMYGNTGYGIHTVSDVGLIRNIHLIGTIIDTNTAGGWYSEGAIRTENLQMEQVWSSANVNGAGIYLGPSIVDFRIVGGFHIVNGHEGIKIDGASRGQISGTSNYNNSQSTASTYYGIWVGNSASRVVVGGENQVYNSGKNSYLTQLGLFFDSTSTNCAAKDNRCDTGTSISPTNTRFNVPPTIQQHGNVWDTTLTSHIHQVGGADDLYLNFGDDSPTFFETMYAPACLSNMTLNTSGALWLSYFTARTPLTITKLYLSTGSGTMGSPVLTTSQMAIYSVDSSGNLTFLGATPNDTTLATAASTTYPPPLSSSVTLVAGQRYALGWLGIGTMGTINLRGSSQIVTLADPTGKKRKSAVITSVTASSLLGNFGNGSISNNGNMIWMACSS